MTVVQELTLTATLMALGMLVIAILCVVALMGALHLGLYMAERREKQVTTEYGGSRYGRATF